MVWLEGESRAREKKFGALSDLMALLTSAFLLAAGDSGRYAFFGPSGPEGSSQGDLVDLTVP
jgi:hypothetical protein